MRTRQCHLSCPNMHQHVPYGTHLDLINGVQNDEFRMSQETLKTFKLDACNACGCGAAYFHFITSQSKTDNRVRKIIGPVQMHLNLEISVCTRAHAQLSYMLYQDILEYHTDEITKTLCYINRNCYYL